jgi:riboflavin biosynthesis pyrimidine reductase
LSQHEPGVEFHNCSPVDLVAIAKNRYHSILIEGGNNFLKSLIPAKVIDEVFLTRVRKDGDGYIFDEGELRQNYLLRSEEIFEDLSFERWDLNPQR